MDKLSATLAEARKMGMSYGQYMVYQSRNQKSEPKKELVFTPATEKPKAVCKICGKGIPPNSGRRSYCSNACNEKWIRDNARDLARKKKGISSDDILICPCCGKEFVRGNRHGGIKYCSPECQKARFQKK